MKLSSRLESSFPSAVRKRGLDYYARGLVRVKHGSADELEARVRGSESYEVDLLWEAPVISTWCDCPYFDSEGRCKHIWATILAADAHGYLSEAANAKVIMLDDVGADPDVEDFEEEEEEFALTPPAARARVIELPGSKPKPINRPPAWKAQIEGIANAHALATSPYDKWPAKKQIVYDIDLASSVAANRVILWLGSRDRKADGTYGRVGNLSLKRSQICSLPAEDCEILSAIVGGVEYYGWSDSGYQQVASSHLLAPPLASMIVPRMARTGRCHLRYNPPQPDAKPLIWDEGAPWRFELQIDRLNPRGWSVTGVFSRDAERLRLEDAILVTPNLIFTRDRVAPLAEDAAEQWIRHLRSAKSIVAPPDAGAQLVAELLRMPCLPPLQVPDELSYEEVTARPRPLVRIRSEKANPYGQPKLSAQLLFDYEGRLIEALEPNRGVYDAEARRFLRRDPAEEEAAAALLKESGFRFQNANYRMEPGWELAPTKLPRAVRMLVEAGWHIEADGKVFRRPGSFQMEVSSGVDWFELHGAVEYGETSARLPELLEALRRGDGMVALNDGTYGMLPEEWLQRIGMIAGLGTANDGHIRFRPNQAGLLDALLAAQPEARFDAAFALVREKLRRFEGIRLAPQPAGFVGRLREYQREGLGWMEFLREYSFGGCLADDMGVGKTAQVLALLETRRELRAAGEPLPPSLVVVPKSLVFNWKEEAARFTPQLRVLDYTGTARKNSDLTACDLVITTYGTLRRDVVRLKDFEFDYLVLDEAQAVKNAGTESAKAVRLLKGKHRLALSGTPIENRLGDLFSLFEFLNPGMLGTASVFNLMGGAARNPDEETRRLLAHALRPFILRRTKEQVARELPEKTEQTIFCEMEAGQRKLYNELRQHYRDLLLRRIETEGLAKSKIQVLEALLRLRQAACHPALIDTKRSKEGSAKLDVLLDQLRDVLAEGHKALVFSQFTSLLKIVRKRLDADGIVYEYLDGATRDRQARVERFQNDSRCQLFLISLKAGGLGLNLTAAGYVFLLDPWWNPAVEAQAVDRAHRIGQTQRVFAYRLITRDTVEEKVLELQKTKRDLADAIISADNSVIRDLKREDLEVLLS